MNSRMIQIQMLIAAGLTAVLLILRACNVIDFPINGDYVQLGFIWEWFMQTHVQYWREIAESFVDDKLLSLNL